MPSADAFSDPALTQTAETQAAMSPASALERLRAGNARFVAGRMVRRDLRAQVTQTATGQHPFAIVLGCVDSRVPPEIVFDQGVGDIFSARVAGNVVNADILGSMEFATAVAGSKVVVVLGHTQCGAVKGACDHVEMGHLTHLLQHIAPAVEATETDGERSSSNLSFVNDVARANVERVLDEVMDRSDVIAGQVRSGEVMLVGAMHDVETGEVTFSDPVVSENAGG